jgi:hypothetical protein
MKKSSLVKIKLTGAGCYTDDEAAGKELIVTVDVTNEQYQLLKQFDVVEIKII